MNHKNYLITSIAIFFVLLIGGAGVTYILLTHQPTVATKPLTKTQYPSKNKQSQDKIPAPIYAQVTTEDSSSQTEKVATESGPSLVHASTISTATPTKTNATSKTFEA